MTTPIRSIALLAIGIGLFCSHSTLHAHAAHPSFLRISTEDSERTGLWSIPLAELTAFLETDGATGHIQWSEVEAREAALKEDLFQDLYLTLSEVPHAVSAGEILYDLIDEEPYLVFPFTLPSDTGKEGWTLHYSVFERLGEEHRCLATIDGPEGETTTVLTPKHTILPLASNLSSSHLWVAFIGEGIWHILIGYDHILFLLALMIPAVLGDYFRKDGFKEVLRRSVSIVTIFALGHSITLGISALGWLRPPAASIEVAIAVSVGLAALSNLTPRGQRHGHRIAFGFGLLHGFGFANVLAGLNLTGLALIPTWLSFNLGVELGQLLILAVVIPIAFALREMRGYRVALLRGSSIAILGVSVFWVIARI